MNPAKDQTVRAPPGWVVDEAAQRLSITVKTKDFMSAVGIVNEIAMIAEDVDHHPDLAIKGWNHLEISTWSHDVGRLTERDERLAQRIDELLRRKNLKK